MDNREGSDIDDDFSELYKEYTGPPVLSNVRAQDVPKGNKRSHAGSDEEEEPRDPNAVPTDFTSREAKVWEAKSKATERNWKKRKEEEMICKICGESGHFTQGCPSTLGANRKSQDFFERVPAREQHVKALFSQKVINGIEKDIGCKIKVEEKFIIVSGKDRLILAKGVDAVHKVKEEGNKKDSSSSHVARSKSPERSPVATRFTRSDSQRSNHSPQTASLFQQRFGKQEKAVEDDVREDLKKLSRSSPKAYVIDGARGRSSHSKSPGHPPYKGTSYKSYDGHNQNRGGYQTDGWDTERRGSDLKTSNKMDYPMFPRTLEELELEYNRDATDLGRIRDKEEDEENYKHREAVREMRESFTKRMANLREMHAKQWEEFLHLNTQRKQERAVEQLSNSRYAGYRQPGYSDFDGYEASAHYGGNLAPESRGRYQNSVETFPPSRSHDAYGDYQRQRHEEFGKAYNRY
ncbi:hypothetical protein DCAR_0103023 [Daucus carota subsp. sativus]|uniref:Uncharacterized protein n=1 Tax=Daucus carota subsp. sativus TaxID=79200 RepID=A0A162AKC3_DAUCS|nr:PREDICTED: uncharacterized protein LOC108205065 isoform X2 [Daucus carota subsp. sativus]WOG83845.1 hypothetical protein DCAR_0103023 [Daucus carota subsp. sativus]